MTTTLNDIIDNLTIIFKQIVANKITAGDKGKVLFLYKNTELEAASVTTYKSAIFTLSDTTLAKYIKQLFKGGCKKVIVLQYPSNISGVVSLINEMKSDFDWILSADSDAQTDIIAYAKENKKFTMTYNNQADSRYVCSFSNPSATYINEDGTTSTLSGVALIPVLGGWACGCPYNMAIDGKVFDELKDVTMPSAYNAGQLVLIKEEEGVRFANECNTLTTTSSTLTDDMKSLAISEGMQRVEIDLIKGYRQGYKGKYKNSYDNQCLFYNAVKHGYFRELENVGIEILDKNYDNTIGTDVETQRNKWLTSGKSEAADWDENKVKEMTYKREVIALADVKFLAGMGPLQITVEMF